MYAKSNVRITSRLDLEQSIAGLLCREKFLSDAQLQKIHKQNTFKKEFSKSKNKSMIKIIENTLLIRYIALC